MFPKKSIASATVAALLALPVPAIRAASSDVLPSTARYAVDACDNYWPHGNDSIGRLVTAYKYCSDAQTISASNANLQNAIGAALHMTGYFQSHNNPGFENYRTSYYRITKKLLAQGRKAGVDVSEYENLIKVLEDGRLRVVGPDNSSGEKCLIEQPEVSREDKLKMAREAMIEDINACVNAYRAEPLPALLFNYADATVTLALSDIVNNSPEASTNLNNAKKAFEAAEKLGWQRSPDTKRIMGNIETASIQQRDQRVAQQRSQPKSGPTNAELAGGAVAAIVVYGILSSLFSGSSGSSTNSSTTAGMSNTDANLQSRQAQEEQRRQQEQEQPRPTPPTSGLYGDCHGGTAYGC